MQFTTHTVITAADRDAMRRMVCDTRPSCIAVDTETTGVRDGDCVIGVCISIPPWDRGWYIPYYGTPERTPASVYPDRQHLDAVHALLVEVLTYPAPKIFHNALFDVPMLYTSMGIVVTDIAHDVMLMSHVLNPDGQHRLKDLAVRYIDIEADTLELALQAAARQLGGRHEYWRLPPAEVAPYGVADAIYTGRLHELLLAELTAPNRVGQHHVYTRISMPLLRELIGVKVHGIPVDRAYLERGVAWYTARLDHLTQQIRDLVSRETGITNFNPGSFAQINDLLFKKLCLPARRKTQTGYATDEQSLQALSDAHPVVALILAYRASQKLLSTYFEGILHALSADGRYRPDINLIGTRTGRLSMSGIHQIPRATPLDDWLVLAPRVESGPQTAPLVREAFAAPDGYVFVGGDYSQAEARVLAHFSQDPELCRIYRAGEDIHAATAKLLFGLPEDVTSIAAKYPEHRQRAKTINFALLYLETVAGLRRQLQCDHATARTYYEKFFSIYSAIPRWAAAEIRAANRQGYISTLFGRIRYRQSTDEEMQLRTRLPPPGRRPAQAPACYATPHTWGGIGLSTELDLGVSIVDWTPACAEQIRSKLRTVRPQCSACPFLYACYRDLESRRLQHMYEHRDRQLLNTKIQGTAADLANLGIIRLGAHIERHQLDAQLVIYVHDEVHYLVSTRMNIDAFAQDMSRIMQSVDEYLSIPCVFAARVGRTWAAMK